MGVNLEWQDEDGRVLDSVLDAQSEFSRTIASTDASGMSCVRFIDPYGDTVFNQLQCGELLAELKVVFEGASSPTLASMVELVETAEGRAHTYLKFVGD